MVNKLILPAQGDVACWKAAWNSKENSEQLVHIGFDTILLEILSVSIIFVYVQFFLIKGDMFRNAATKNVGSTW